MAFTSALKAMSRSKPKKSFLGLAPLRHRSRMPSALSPMAADSMGGIIPSSTLALASMSASAAWWFRKKIAMDSADVEPGMPT